MRLSFPAGGVVVERPAEFLSPGLAALRWDTPKGHEVATVTLTFAEITDLYESMLRQKTAAKLAAAAVPPPEPEPDGDDDPDDTDVMPLHAERAG